MTVLQPRDVFLKGLGAIPLKCKHQAEYCPHLPGSVREEGPHFHRQLAPGCITTFCHKDMKNINFPLYKANKVTQIITPIPR